MFLLSTGGLLPPCENNKIDLPRVNIFVSTHAELNLKLLQPSLPFPLPPLPSPHLSHQELFKHQQSRLDYPDSPAYYLRGNQFRQFAIMLSLQSKYEIDPNRQNRQISRKAWA